MALSSVFYNGVETIFSVFTEKNGEGAVKEAMYTIVSDDGFGTASKEEFTCRLIPDRFTKRDSYSTPFGSEIQPTDVKGLVPGNDIANNAMDIKSGDTIAFEGFTYTVVDFFTDAYKALYTFLLRKV